MGFFFELPQKIEYFLRERSSRLVGFFRYAGDALRASLSHRLCNGPAPSKMLLLSDGLSAHSEAQWDVFYWFRRELRDRLGLIFRRETLDPSKLPASLAEFDIIGLKFFYKTPEEAVLETARLFATAKRPDAKLIYFDGNDELTIQWPGLLEICDLYWKKQTLKNRDGYRNVYVGGTNLTDYVERKSGAVFARRALDDKALAKLACGTSVGLDNNILRLVEYLRDDSVADTLRPRPIDMVLRANVPDNWMGQLRRPPVEILEAISDRYRVVLPHERVLPERYVEEMLSSKICISPFGYGEICYRDCEAAAYGCLLFKPDMSHAESNPDVFRAFETYVPVRWDYGDLEDKIRHYLQNDSERNRIVRNARRVLLEAQDAGWVVAKTREMLQLAGISV